MRARIFCIASVLLIGIVSCKDKQPFIPDVPDPEPGGHTAQVLTEYRFTSSSAEWQEGDRIKVFFDGGEYIAVATFHDGKFVASSAADCSYPHDIFAGWPADRFSYYDNGIIAALPSAQVVAEAGNTDRDCAAITAIAGTAAGGSTAELDFSEIFSVMELTLSDPSGTFPDEEFKSLSITSGNTPLCGYCSVNIADGKVSGIVAGSNSVSLSSGAFSSTSVVRLYVAETDFSEDVLSVRADSDDNAIIRTIETPAFSGGKLTASLPIDAACKVLQKKIFSGGAGTGSDPWQINTAKDLADLFDYTNDEETIPEVFKEHDFTTDCFVLGGDIDMASYGELPPLYKGSAFKGRFDGAGHRISNLTIKGGGDKAGLFSSVAKASICNLVLKNLAVSTSSCAGGVCGSAAGADISGCTVSASTVTSSGNYVGGILGYVENTDLVSISSCVVGSGCAVSGYGYVGGILGCSPKKTAADVKIDKCVVYANITCDNQVIGGIVGGAAAEPVNSDLHNVGGEMVISNCAYIGGQIYTKYKSDANAYLGGIVGLGTRTAAPQGLLVSVINCYTRPSLLQADITPGTTKRWSVGGISGGMFAATSIYGCWSDITADEISVKNNTAFGSIVSQMQPGKGNEILYCYGIIDLKGDGNGVVDSSCQELTLAQLTGGTLRDNLNGAVTNYTGGKATLSAWGGKNGEYPTLEGMLADPDKASN